ncbi:hypothetical protein LMG26842_05381 [Achromobacter dolens]|nr:hypothetical protein LMG26842_05381 [Achromobacter dolens]
MSHIPADDVDEKARRNFVAISAAILLGWWLRVDVPFLANFVGLATDGQTRFRIWIAAVPILLYFGLRYHFSVQRANGWKACRQDHMRRLYRRLEKPLARIIHTKEKAAHDQRTHADGTPYPPFTFSPSSYSVDVSHIEWYRASCTWRRSDDGPGDFEQRFPHDPEDNHAFDIDGCEWIRIHLITAFGSLIFSRGSIVILVPYVLGVLALIACGYKIAFLPHM